MKTTKNFSQDSYRSGPDSNREPLKHSSEALPRVYQLGPFYSLFPQDQIINA
jgi:hypothetical protein